MNNGVDGMAWGRLNAVCEKLQIDPVSLEPIRLEKGKNTAEEKRLMAYYELLNSEGKKSRRIFEGHQHDSDIL